MEINLKAIFTEAIINIFREIGLEEIRIYEVDVDNVVSNVVTNIGITGDLCGNLMLNIDKTSALYVANYMLKRIGSTPDENNFGMMHKEAISEITNLVTARAIMLLSNQQIDCNLTPPTIITGNNIRTKMYNTIENNIIGIDGKFGHIVFFIGIKAKNK